MDFFEKLVQDVYATNLETSAAQYPVLLSESPIHNKEQRQKMCEIMFEKFNVPAFFLCKTGVLSW